LFHQPGCGTLRLAETTITGTSAASSNSGRKECNGLAAAFTLIERLVVIGRKQPERPFLYRETPAHGGQQCVRMGDWKLVRQHMNANPQDPQPPTTELYNLTKDPFETTDIAAQQPDDVK
jgi:hypothetical protein